MLSDIVGECYQLNVGGSEEGGGRGRGEQGEGEEEAQRETNKERKEPNREMCL